MQFTATQTILKATFRLKRKSRYVKMTEVPGLQKPSLIETYHELVLIPDTIILGINRLYLIIKQLIHIKQLLLLL